MIVAPCRLDANLCQSRGSVMPATCSFYQRNRADRSLDVGRPARRLHVRYVAPLIAILAASLFLSLSQALAAQGPVGLGKAQSFAVLAGSGITNTGPTTITGDVGTFPTPSETGFGSITLIGTNHGGDAVTQGAKNDLVTAYEDAFGRKPVTNVPVELGGSTLLAGVYKSGTFALTGTLTLDAQGNTGAEFIFQAGSTVITESNSRVLLLNGADPCHVVWQVGSSATFKTGTRFIGDVLAYTSITAQTGATFQGRLLAQNGAVTLDTNTVTKANCVPGASSTPTPTTSTTAETTPGTIGAATPSASSGPIAEEAGPASPTGGSIAALVPPAGPPRAGTPGGGSPRTPWTPPSLAVTGVAILGLLATGFVLLNLGGITRVLGRRGRKAQIV